MTGTAVAKKAKKAEIAAAMGAMFEHAQADGNDFKADDLAIPRIAICQALSPQRQKRDPAYIEGLEEGIIFNTVLGIMHGEAVRVIPVDYQKVYNIWRRRTSGGGFLGTYHDQAEAQEECPADADVSDTGEYYLLVEGEDGWTQASLSFKSTGMKISRQWNSLIAARRVTIPGDDRPFNPPMYAQVFTLSSVESTNDKGTWFGWHVAPSEDLVPALEHGADLYQGARNFREMVRGGRARISYEEPETIEAEVIEEGAGNPDF